jgi:2-methylisocitrate lyase-like PEP mutase family enzyme
MTPKDEHSFSARRAKLAARLKEKHLLSAPGIFEMVSAKMADAMNFDALYMTGYGTVASYLGLPDAGIATYADMVNRVQRFAAITKTPLICDADTGYGGLLNVAFTVQGYEAAGAAAIQLEDQEFPKKCGHMAGRKVTSTQAMVDKIRVAVDSRNDPNFQIIARTDARTTEGIDEALRRGERYAKAGADILFIESPETPEEMERIARNFDVPLIANMVEGGRTPVMSRAELEALGFRVAIFPATAFLAAGHAMDRVYRTIRTQGSSVELDVPVYPFQAFSSLMGFDEIYEFEEKYGRDLA